jgi:pilus assembly protein CpaE
MQMEPITLGLVTRKHTLSGEIQSLLERSHVRLVLESSEPRSLSELVMQVERANPDVVLLDVSAVDELADAIRRVKSTSGTPLVVAVHSSSDTQIILEAMRAGASEFLFPPFESNLQPALHRLGAERVQQRSPQRINGKVIGFLSVKGGCGSTTLACHVGVEVHRATMSPTLLADFDLDAGIIGFLLKVQSRYTLLDAAKNVYRLDPSFWKAMVFKHRAGVDVLKAPPPALTHTAPNQDEVRAILSLARSIYSYTILDLGRGLNRLSLSTLELVDTAYLVTVPDVPSLHQAKLIISALRDYGFGQGKLQLMLNRMQKTPEVTPAELERAMGLPVFGTIPNDYFPLYEAYAEGGLLPAKSKLMRHFETLARRIAGIPEEKKPSRGGFLAQVFSGA